MNKSTILLVGVAIAAALFAADALARGGGGRGGGGGGGAFGGGGFSGGARSFAVPSMSRAAPSPSMSRPAQFPAATRPSVGAGQGPAAGRLGQMPVGGAARPGAGAGAGRGPSQFPQAGQRPTPSQLSSFLNLPADAGRAQAASAAAAPRAAQLPATGASGSKTITGPHGGEISVAGRGGTRTGPGGTTVGAGRVGVKATGPGGNTYTKVAGGAAIRGPGGNTVSAGRGASFVNGQFVGGKAWTAVNGNFTRWGYFSPGWYGRYPGAWWPGRWAIATTAWATATWATAGVYCGCTGDGCYYDYGENVTYDDGTVYYGDQAAASAEQYYAEAGQIADAGQTPQNEEWLPLGVFAVIADPTQTNTDRVVQLAVNKEGVIRGNFQDSLTDKVIPVVGSVDKKTQRVAMRLQGNDSLVVETGLYNLTNDEVPVLVHFSADRQENRTLIRLKQPEEQPQQPPQG